MLTRGSIVPLIQISELEETYRSIFDWATFYEGVGSIMLPELGSIMLPRDVYHDTKMRHRSRCGIDQDAKVCTDQATRVCSNFTT